jgi:5'-deoxynucleotidase YfbR-like HD superfamily hydrolase
MGIFSDLAETFAGDSVREDAKQQASERIDAATHQLEQINPEAAVASRAVLKQVINESVIEHSSVEELQKYDELLKKVEDAGKNQSLENANEILRDTAEVSGIIGTKLLQSPELQNQINDALGGLGTILQGAPQDVNEFVSPPASMQHDSSRNNGRQ